MSRRVTVIRARYYAFPVFRKGKAKSVQVSGSIVPLIVNLGIMWRWLPASYPSVSPLQEGILLFNMNGWSGPRGAKR
jgi:hypothetical protein